MVSYVLYLVNCCIWHYENSVIKEELKQYQIHI